MTGEDLEDLRAEVKRLRAAHEQIHEDAAVLREHVTRVSEAASEITVRALLAEREVERLRAERAARDAWLGEERVFAERNAELSAEVTRLRAAVERAEADGEVFRANSARATALAVEITARAENAERERDEAKQVLDAATAALLTAAGWIGACVRERDEARAEVERLRLELQDTRAVWMDATVCQTPEEAGTEMERLEAEVARLRAEHVAWEARSAEHWLTPPRPGLDDLLVTAIRERDEARAEVERLRAEVDEVLEREITTADEQSAQRAALAAEDERLTSLYEKARNAAAGVATACGLDGWEFGLGDVVPRVQRMRAALEAADAFAAAWSRERVLLRECGAAGQPNEALGRAYEAAEADTRDARARYAEARR